MPEFQYKNVPTEVRVVDRRKGIVDAYVSTTNIVDHGNDNIVPGAYAKTLRERVPKVCWAHAWEHPIGKCLQAKELLPGNRQLTARHHSLKAGALWTRSQLNLKVQAGRDALEWLLFWTEPNEEDPDFQTKAEWSIGYDCSGTTPDGQKKAWRDTKNGVRYIKALDLFEYSPVAHGMAPLTDTLDIKDMPRPVRVILQAAKAIESGELSPLAELSLDELAGAIDLKDYSLKAKQGPDRDQYTDVDMVHQRHAEVEGEPKQENHGGSKPDAPANGDGTTLPEEDSYDNNGKPRRGPSSEEDNDDAWGGGGEDNDANDAGASKARQLKYSDSQARDDHGRWTSGGGDSSPDTGTVKTDDVNLAAKALLEGKHVELSQPRQVGVLLDRLAAIAKDAQSKGQKAGTYNLCNVSVPGTDLFCAGNKGIDRIHMPQLKGPPEPGTPAASMKPDVRGEVDMTDKFLDSLKSQGVKMTPGTEDVAYMHATQDQLDGVKVAEIMKAAEAGKLDTSSPLVLSKDNYIVDGHHRWAAQVGEEFDSDAPEKPIMVNVMHVDEPIIPLLKQAQDFAGKMGIPQASMNAGRTKAMDECASCDTRHTVAQWVGMITGKDWQEYDADHPDRGGWNDKPASGAPTPPSTAKPVAGAQKPATSAGGNPSPVSDTAPKEGGEKPEGDEKPEGEEGEHPESRIGEAIEGAIDTVREAYHEGRERGDEWAERWSRSSESNPGKSFGEYDAATGEFKDWDEDSHPRDQMGRFTTAESGTGAAEKEPQAKPGPSRTTELLTKPATLGVVAREAAQERHYTDEQVQHLQDEINQLQHQLYHSNEDELPEGHEHGTVGEIIHGAGRLAAAAFNEASEVASYALPFVGAVMKVLIAMPEIHKAMGDLGGALKRYGEYGHREETSVTHAIGSAFHHHQAPPSNWQPPKTAKPGMTPEFQHALADEFAKALGDEGAPAHLAIVFSRALMKAQADNGRGLMSEDAMNKVLDASLPGWRNTPNGNSKSFGEYDAATGEFKDQERDDHGRFTSSGSSGSSKPPGRLARLAQGVRQGLHEEREAFSHRDPDHGDTDAPFGIPLEDALRHADEDNTSDEKKDWSEDDHPRDDRGRFASNGAGGGGLTAGATGDNFHWRGGTPAERSGHWETTGNEEHLVVPSGIRLSMGPNDRDYYVTGSSNPADAMRGTANNSADWLGDNAHTAQLTTTGPNDFPFPNPRPGSEYSPDNDEYPAAYAINQPVFTGQHSHYAVYSDPTGEVSATAHSGADEAQRAVNERATPDNEMKGKVMSREDIAGATGKGGDAARHAAAMADLYHGYQEGGTRSKARFGRVQLGSHRDNKAYYRWHPVDGPKLVSLKDWSQWDAQRGPAGGAKQALDQNEGQHVAVTMNNGQTHEGVVNKAPGNSFGATHTITGPDGQMTSISHTEVSSVKNTEDSGLKGLKDWSTFDASRSGDSWQAPDDQDDDVHSKLQGFDGQHVIINPKQGSQMVGTLHHNSDGTHYLDFGGGKRSASFSHQDVHSVRPAASKDWAAWDAEHQSAGKKPPEDDAEHDYHHHEDDDKPADKPSNGKRPGRLGRLVHELLEPPTGDTATAMNQAMPQRYMP